jgi:hypothetical protein
MLSRLDSEAEELILPVPPKPAVADWLNLPVEDKELFDSCRPSVGEEWSAARLAREGSTSYRPGSARIAAGSRSRSGELCRSLRKRTARLPDPHAAGSGGRGTDDALLTAGSCAAELLFRLVPLRRCVPW